MKMTRLMMKLTKMTLTWFPMQPRTIMVMQRRVEDGMRMRRRNMLDLSLMSNISLEIRTRYFSGDQQRTGVTVLDHFQMFLTFLFQYTLTTGAGDDHYQNLHSHVAMTSIQ